MIEINNLFISPSNNAFVSINKKRYINGIHAVNGVKKFIPNILTLLFRLAKKSIAKIPVQKLFVTLLTRTNSMKADKHAKSAGRNP